MFSIPSIWARGEDQVTPIPNNVYSVYGTYHVTCDLFPLSTMDIIVIIRINFWFSIWSNAEVAWHYTAYDEKCTYLSKASYIIFNHSKSIQCLIYTYRRCLRLIVRNTPMSTTHRKLNTKHFVQNAWSVTSAVWKLIIYCS